MQTYWFKYQTVMKGQNPEEEKWDYGFTDSLEGVQEAKNSILEGLGADMRFFDLYFEGAIVPPQDVVFRALEDAQIDLANAMKAIKVLVGSIQDPAKRRSSALLLNIKVSDWADILLRTTKI